MTPNPLPELDAAQVPLVERLRDVPLRAVLKIDTPNSLGVDTRSIPVGVLCHEAADTLSRRKECEAVEVLTHESNKLRRLLCARIGGALAYMDDGEAQDCSTTPCIDFMRDSADEIERKLIERFHALLASAPPKPVEQAPAPQGLTDEQIFDIADSDECNPDDRGWGPKFSIRAFARAIESALRAQGDAGVLDARKTAGGTRNEGGA